MDPTQRFAGKEHIMAQMTRRDVLKKTSAGAAAVGALIIAPGLVSADVVAAGRAPTHTPPSTHEPLVAYVRDVSAGELTLMVGTREIVVRDHALVMRLVQAAQ
jgi:hypothetical protein